MKNICRITVVIVLLIFLLRIEGFAAPVFAKLGTALSSDHPTSKSLSYLEETLEQALTGQMIIQIFPDAQLGTAYEILEGLQFGNIELGVLSSELLSSHSPLLATISMPYIFRDNAHRFQVLDGPIGMELLKSLEELNLIGLGFLDTGMRNLAMKQGSIRKPGELEGIEIGILLRACAEYDCQGHPITEIITHSLETMGVVVKPIPSENIYEALQSDQIAGLEGNISDLFFLHIEQTDARYVTDDMHVAVPDIIVASKRWFDTLSPNMQTTLQKAARMTVQHQRKFWAESVREITSGLEVQGMKFEQVDRAIFYNAVQPVYTEMFKKFGPDFAEIIRSIMAVK